MVRAEDEEEASGADSRGVTTSFDLICPVCGNHVVGYKVGAYNTTGTDRDFCQRGATPTFYRLLVSTCPKCGYTAYADDFRIKMTDQQKSKIRVISSKFLKKEDVADWDRYDIVAEIMKIRNAKDYDIANAYLRGTYTMRDLPEKNRKLLRIERNLRAKAIRRLLIAVDKASFSVPEQAQIKYLIGELYRRNGRFSAALRHFQYAKAFKIVPLWLKPWIEEQNQKALKSIAD